MSVIRSRNLNFVPQEPKKFTKDFIAIMCPIIDLVNHSFSPNCRIEGQYLPLEGESLVILRSLTTINPGEELTINYGDYSNADFLMKFGFLNSYNPFNELRLELDYQQFLQYTEQQFELKRKILRTVDQLNLEEIAIFGNRINENILKMLRIYFLTNEDIHKNPEISTFLWKDFKNPVSKANEQAISQFMIAALQEKLRFYQENRKKLVKEDIACGNGEEFSRKSLENCKLQEDLRIALSFCAEEEEILRNNLKFFTKKKTELDSQL